MFITIIVYFINELIYNELKIFNYIVIFWNIFLLLIFKLKLEQVIKQIIILNKEIVQLWFTTMLEMYKILFLNLKSSY